NQPIIKQLESELEAALLKGDAVILDRILADDYIEISSRGEVRKKADVIAAARARRAAPRGVSVGPDSKVDDLKILFHGASAFVVGRRTIHYQFMENQTSSPLTQLQNPAKVDQ